MCKSASSTARPCDDLQWRTIYQSTFETETNERITPKNYDPDEEHRNRRVRCSRFLAAHKRKIWQFHAPPMLNRILKSMGGEFLAPQPDCDPFDSVKRFIQ
jgi:hypothetical protein